MASGYVYSPDIRGEALSLIGERVPKAEVARRLGVARTTIQCWTSKQSRKRRAQLKRVAKAQAIEDAKLPVASLREAVQMCQEPRGAICQRMGWSRGDTSKLARVLGEMPDQQGGVAERITEDLALKILRAIHLDPVDVGL